MFITALLIVVGLLIVGVCILSLNSSLERRINEATRAPDEAGAERAEAMRQISRDITKGGGDGFY
jgi:HAMP domain-containing protein